MEEDLKKRNEEKTSTSSNLTREMEQEYEIIDEIIKSVHPSWNNLEKALFVYIELERRLDKTTSSETARLYNSILTRLEIPNRIINGIVINTIFTKKINQKNKTTSQTNV